MAQLSAVLAAARTYLNDDNGTTWTDQILIPKAQEAFREVQNKLWNVGAQITRYTNTPTTIVANANPTTFVPAMSAPSTFMNPVSILENASPVPAAPTNWIPMTEVTYLPAGYAAQATINYWSWQEENLIFAPCSVDRSVLITFRRGIAVPTVAASQLYIPFAELYMGARTAAIAAGSQANAEKFASLSAKAKTNLAMVISANRGQQKPSLRP